MSDRYRRAAALTDYDAALRLVPDDPEALAERGDPNERAGLYDRAAEDYGRLIEIEPANAKAWNNRCWDRAVLGKITGQVHVYRVSPFSLGHV